MTFPEIIQISTDVCINMPSFIYPSGKQHLLGAGLLPSQRCSFHAALGVTMTLSFPNPTLFTLSGSCLCCALCRGKASQTQTQLKCHLLRKPSMTSPRSDWVLPSLYPQYLSYFLSDYPAIVCLYLSSV